MPWADGRSRREHHNWVLHASQEVRDSLLHAHENELFAVYQSTINLKDKSEALLCTTMLSEQDQSYQERDMILVVTMMPTTTRTLVALG